MSFPSITTQHTKYFSSTRGSLWEVTNGDITLDCQRANWQLLSTLPMLERWSATDLSALSNTEDRLLRLRRRGMAVRAGPTTSHYHESSKTLSGIAMASIIGRRIVRRIKGEDQRSIGDSRRSHQLLGKGSRAQVLPPVLKGKERRESIAIINYQYQYQLLLFNPLHSRSPNQTWPIWKHIEDLLSYHTIPTIVPDQARN